MTGILVSQPYPDALTCIVVGPLNGVTEVDFAGFREVLWIVHPSAAEPWPKHLLRSNSSLLTTDAPSFPQSVDQFILKTSNRLPSVFVTAGIQSHAAVYEPIVAELRAVLESYHRARVTRQKDGFRWQSHVLANVAGYVKSRAPAEWKGALAGLPAFVCGAGPSLDVSAPALARFADGAVIFSADSALRALARHRVKADFAVSVDVAKVPAKCLPDPQFTPGRAVLSVVSPPEWQAAMPEGSRVFLSSTQLTLDWLAARGIAKTDVQVTESCGSTALDLARYLGCAPIYLFGLDLAADTSDPSKRHTVAAEKSIYTQSGYDATQRQPMVPGNYAERIPSFIYGDWQALDERLAQWPAGLVFNVNDRGARLRNVTLIHPSSFTLTAARDKQPALASLGTGTIPQQPPRILGELRTIGRQVHVTTASLQTKLQSQGPANVVEGLRKLFGNPDVGRVMGGFSLKLMPHLVPPLEGDHAFWAALLDELQTLAALAERTGAD